LAEAFDVTDPWAPSLREPLWVALVKLWSAPFGYAPGALRALTVVLSVALLVGAAVVFARHLRPRLATAATGCVAFHGLLVFSAGRGLREELVGLLVLLCAAVILNPHATRTSTFVVAAAMAVLAAVRIEMGLLCLLLLALAVAVRQVRLSTFLLAALLAALAVGPWLANNSREYGSATASADDAATFWYRADRIGPLGVLQPGDAPPAGSERMSWYRYVVVVVGPVEAAGRVAVGTAGLLHDGIASAVWPLEDRWVENRTDNDALRSAARIAGAGSSWAAWAVLPLLALGVASRQAPVGPRVLSAVVVVSAAAAYGLLWSLPFFDLRFIQFSVPFLCLLVVTGAMDGWRRWRRWHGNGSSSTATTSTLGVSPCVVADSADR
jgi:hypothetical protein